MKIKNDTYAILAKIAALAAAANSIQVSAQGTKAAEKAVKRETFKLAFQHPIPNFPGKTLSEVLVDYAPGSETPPHRHDGAVVVGYVLEGAVISQLAGGKAQVFKAGESWTEAPGAHHVVSQNADKSKTAKLLAVFIHDSNLQNLTTLDSAK